MFRSVLRALSAPATTAAATLAADDARLALSALLVRIARSDGEYSDAEIARIESILATRYGLEAGAVTALRHEAELLEEAAPDTVRFTRAIKAAVPYEEREAVVHAAWQVVLADGERAHEEDALMRLISSLLGVNDRDSNILRRRAAGLEG